MEFNNETGYITVVDEDESTIELPIEENGTVLLSTIQAQFPKCTGLQFSAKGSGTTRGIRLTQDCLYPPPGGWGDTIYHCVIPKETKRRLLENSCDAKIKTKRLENRQCTDLVVLNLTWRTDEGILKKYFSHFGEVVMAQVKRDPDTHQSRGFGFIRFADYESQALCLAEDHHIDGRPCEVKVPNSKVEGDKQEVIRKVHVGQIAEFMTPDLLGKFFSSYGTVIAVFVPSPFRAFAFVTFEDPKVASQLLGKVLKIENHPVTIGSAVPKVPTNRYDKSLHKIAYAKSSTLNSAFTEMNEYQGYRNFLDQSQNHFSIEYNRSSSGYRIPNPNFGSDGRPYNMSHPRSYNKFQHHF